MFVSGNSPNFFPMVVNDTKETDLGGRVTLTVKVGVRTPKLDVQLVTVDRDCS